MTLTEQSRMVLVHRLIAEALRAEVPAARLPLVLARVCAAIEPHVNPAPVPARGIAFVNGQPYDLRSRDRLTDREIEILAAAAHGLTNEQIGRHFGVTANTVKTHLKHIFARLDVRDRAEAVAVAMRRGLIG